MDVVDTHCIVAAILTTASIDNTGLLPRNVVNRYIEILDALNEAGGHREPKPLDLKRPYSG
jgi:hypothetical protein